MTSEGLPLAANADFVVTGLPRSGTSLLCKLLNDQAATVVVNEPEEVFGQFLRARFPKSLWVPRPSMERFGGFYRDLRERLDSGAGIENKVVEDTRKGDSRVSWAPDLGADGIYRLAIKNTLLFTTHLEPILAAGYPVVALVRHPYDAVLSWSTCDQDRFRHLRDGRIPSFDRMQAGALSAEATAEYRALADMEEGSIARLAAYWCFLAGQYRRFSEQITVIRYEDLVTRTASLVADVVGGKPEEMVIPENLAPRRYPISDEDAESVWSACGELAVHFGYQPQTG